MEQILLTYALQKETLTAVKTFYKDTKAMIYSSDNDIDFFDIVARRSIGTISILPRLQTIDINNSTVWLGLVLWHINHCRLFNAKSSLYIYIKYIGFDPVGFYGISTIVGYLMPNPLYTYILNI